MLSGTHLPRPCGGRVLMPRSKKPWGCRCRLEVLCRRFRQRALRRSGAAGSAERWHRTDDMETAKRRPSLLPERLNLTLDATSDGIWDWNLATGKSCLWLVACHRSSLMSQTNVPSPRIFHLPYGPHTLVGDVTSTEKVSKKPHAWQSVVPSGESWRCKSSTRCFA